MSMISGAQHPRHASARIGRSRSGPASRTVSAPASADIPAHWRKEDPRRQALDRLHVVSASVPFRLWIEQGCPAVFDWEGHETDAEEALLHEYDAIVEAGPQVLEDWECERLRLPLGATNADAHRELRKRWPVDLPERPRGT